MKGNKKDEPDINTDKDDKVPTDKIKHKIDTTKGKNKTNVNAKNGKKDTKNDKIESNEPDNNNDNKVPNDNTNNRKDTTKDTKGLKKIPTKQGY